MNYRHKYRKDKNVWENPWTFLGQKIISPMMQHARKQVKTQIFEKHKYLGSYLQ